MEFSGLAKQDRLKRREREDKVSNQKKGVGTTLSNILNLNWQDLKNLKNFSNEDLVIIGTIFPDKTNEIINEIKKRKIDKKFFKEILKKYGFLASCILLEFQSFYSSINDYIDILKAISSHARQVSMKEFAWKLMGKKDISINQYQFLYEGIQNFQEKIILQLISKAKTEKDIIKIYREIDGYEQQIFEEKIMGMKKITKNLLYFVINNFDWVYKSKAFDLFKKLFPQNLTELAQNCEIITYQALGLTKQSRKINNFDKEYALIKNSEIYRHTRGNQILEMPLNYQQRAICEIEDQNFTDKIFQKIQETPKDEDYIKALKYIINNSERYKTIAGNLLIENYQSYEDLIFVAKNFPNLKEKSCELILAKYGDIKALKFVMVNSKEFGEEAGETLLLLCEKDFEIDEKTKKDILYLIMKSYDKYYQKAIELLMFFMSDEELLKYLLEGKEGNSIIWERLKQTKLTSQQLGEIIIKYGKYSNISKQAFEILKNNDDNIETLKEIIQKQSYHRQQCIESILGNEEITPQDIIWLVENVPMYIGIIWDNIEKSQNLINDETLLAIFQNLSKILNEDKSIEDKSEKNKIIDEPETQGNKAKQLQQEIHRLERTTTFYVIENYNITSDLALELAINKEINDDIKHTICGIFIEQTIKEMQQLRKQLDLAKFKNIKLEVNIDMELFAKIFKCVKTLRHHLEEFTWQFCLSEEEITKGKKGITEEEFKSIIDRLTLKSIMK